MMRLSYSRLSDRVDKFTQCFTNLLWLSLPKISRLPVAPLTVRCYTGSPKIDKTSRQRRESVRTKFLTTRLASTRQWAEGTECPITRVILVCNKPAPRCQWDDSGATLAEGPRGGGAISVRICSSWNIIYASHPARRRLSCDPFDPAGNPPTSLSLSDT